MIDLTGDYQQDASLWMLAHNQADERRKEHELAIAKLAAKIQERYGAKWVHFLSEEGHLTVTRQTVENKIKWGQAIASSGISDSQAIKIGMKRLLQLLHLGRLTAEWVNKAETLSGRDWSKEMKGEEDELDVCPTCGKKRRVG